VQQASIGLGMGVVGGGRDEGRERRQDPLGEMENANRQWESLLLSAGSELHEGDFTFESRMTIRDSARERPALGWPLKPRLL
jgi:hypothetical protein